LKLLLNAYSGSGGDLGRDGRGLARSARRVGDRLRVLRVSANSSCPYERGDVLAALHRAGEVLWRFTAIAATRVRARLPEAVAGRFSEYARTPD